MSKLLQHNCDKETNYGYDYCEKNKEFHINSCGGCYALAEVKFCAFCGKELKLEDMVER